MNIEYWSEMNESLANQQLKQKNDDMDTMTPFEPITEGQIGKIMEVVSAKLRKQKGELPSKEMQEIIETQADSLAIDFLGLIRDRVELISGMIIRTVKVNRNQSPQQVLDATGREQYTDNSVVETMPKGEGEETEVIFFKVGRQINDDTLEKEYELRGLKPADPYSQAKVNEDDPAFADTQPNGTHWKDPNGKWCFATFNRWDDGERFVDVDRDDNGWHDDWWFAGVRK